MTNPTTPTSSQPPRGAGRRNATLGAVVLVAVAAVSAGAFWMGRSGKGDAAGARTAQGNAAVAAAAAPGPEALPAEAQTLLDGGNASFRDGKFEAALGHYRAAALKAPDHAAPWYGVHMVAQKLGRKALADSALAAVRDRTNAPDVWSDSATRKAHEAPGGPAAPGGPGTPAHPPITTPGGARGS